MNLSDKSIYAPGTMAMMGGLDTFGNPMRISYFICKDPKTDAFVADNPYQGIASDQRWPYNAYHIADKQIVMLLKAEKDEYNGKNNYLRLLVGERAGWTFIKRRTWETMVQRYRSLNK